MQGRTRSQKPTLIVGLEKSTRKRRTSKISDKLEQNDIRIESCLNIEPSISLLVEPLGKDTQFEEEVTPSKLSGETSSETIKLIKENFKDLGEEVEDGYLIIS